MDTTGCRQSQMLRTCYKPRDGVVIRDISGQSLLVSDVGKEVQLFELNDTGRLIWGFLDGQTTTRAVIQKLKQQSHHSEHIDDDIIRFLQELRDLRLIIPTGSESLRQSIRHCHSLDTVSYGEVMSTIVSEGLDERVPLFGGIDFTFRCNLGCEHCYKLPVHKPGKPELDTGEWKRILDELVAAGCLELAFTGGEPFLRKDFLEVYLYAKSVGLAVTVFTNSTLITECIAKVLSEHPPHSLEISVYGGTCETYDAVTKRRGAFMHFLKGVRIVQEYGIPFCLKAMIWKSNLHELDEMRDIVKSFQAEFIVDSIIQPRLDGSCEPCQYRIPPALSVELEMSSDANRRAWLAFLSRRQTEDASCFLYDCNAGINSFQINPYGELGLCIMAREPRYDLTKGSFLDGWNGAIKEVRFSRWTDSQRPCRICELRKFCDHCPGWATLESGGSEHRVPYLCAIAQERRRHLENPKKEVRK